MREPGSANGLHADMLAVGLSAAALAKSVATIEPEFLAAT